MKLLNNQLSITETITSADTILSLSSDVESIIFGILQFSNGTKKVVQFLKEEDQSLYRGRLVIYPEDMEFLDSSSFYLELINGELSKKTNKVKLIFNKEQIKITLRKEVSDQYKSVLASVKKLDEKISALTLGKVLKEVPIINKSLIKPGMIPVAIDDKGNFVAMYPFANLISSVNGQQAVDGAIKLDSSMIEYKENDGTIKEAIEAQTSAIQALKHLIDEIVENEKEIRQQLNEVDMKIESHINNGII